MSATTDKSIERHGFDWSSAAATADRKRRHAAERRLRAAIGEVTERLVVEPIEHEVIAYRTTRDGLAAASR